MDIQKNEGNELDESNSTNADEIILRLLADGEEMEMNSLTGKYSIDEVQAGIRRLYLGGKIRKRKEGKQIFYKIADTAGDDMDNDEVDGLEGETQTDRKNISKIARKFRSCRYKVTRGYIAPNGMGYSLAVEKKGITYLISYVAETGDWQPDVFSKMLENEADIRIVVPDNPTKLSVAKIFNKFVQAFGEEEDGLLSFNREHSFRVLTMEQFARKTTWRNLVKQKRKEP